ncbi:uncharacterized protein LOC124155300 isoform X2 [Ischnura elegans]|uniref:uncharacterized protein LOC124155300 isoform X2 n=1 Tax=Ischnura elegans TaxID=197161 RepID=UPI001ED8861C|nr:uncharacterized protein LOC124155300 isoform X2 [Ischnura elegans]
MDEADEGLTSRRREAAATSGSSVALVAVIGGGATSAFSDFGDGPRGTYAGGPTSDAGLLRRHSQYPTDEAWANRKPYPFALILRLRVLQIVCGISAMVMGTVGLIEERGRMNLGFGVPAGAATVLAAAASIHGSRGFGGYRPPSPPRRTNCSAPSPSDAPEPELRTTRPSALISRLMTATSPGPRWRHYRRLLYSAGHLATLLWALAAGLCCTLLVKGVIALVKAPPEIELDDAPWMRPQRTTTLATVAGVQLVLAMTILSSAFAALHIRCFGDPDSCVD